MLKNDHILLVLLVIFAAFITYYLPLGLDKILYFIFPVLFYKSNKNYLWIAFLFVLIEQPGGLFFGGSKDAVNRLPLYSFGSFSVSFEQIMVLIALIKAISLKKKFNPYIKNFLNLFLILFLLLLILSVPIGVNFRNIKLIFRIIINLTLFYSLYFLIQNEEDWIKFFKIIFPFALYAIVLQIYSLIVGHQLINIFIPSIITTQGVLGETRIFGWTRPIEMTNLLFLTFLGSLYFLNHSKSFFNKNYLIVINIISFIAVFFTATRSWVLAFTSAYLFLILLNRLKFGKIIIKYSLTILIIIFVASSINIVKTQLSSAFDRIATIKLIAQGDITAGGTVKRYDVRAPAVIDAFKNSTIIFGAAFSDYYFLHQDGHVGYHNFLFNTGIVGFIVLLLFIINYFIKFLRVSISLSYNNPYRHSIKIFPVAFLSILILNAGTQFIGFDIILNRIIVLIVIFYFGNTILNKTMQFI